MIYLTILLIPLLYAITIALIFLIKGKKITRAFLEKTVIIIRPLWYGKYGAFNWFCTPYYFIALFFAGEKCYRQARLRESVFYQIKNLDDLCAYFRNHYTYRADPLKGLIDHRASTYEFFAANGDCDDMATYAQIALERLNKSYGCQYECYFIYAFPPDVRKSHNDCFVYDKTMNIWFAFNFGKPAKATTLEALLKFYQRKMCAESPEEVNIYLQKKWI